MMKGYNPERAGWGRCTGQGVGKRAGSFHAASKCDMFPSLQVHQSEALPLGFLWRFHSTCSVMCQLIVTLDCSLPGSSVQGISQARILEWFAISFSSGSSWPRDQTHVSHVSCTGAQVLYHIVWAIREAQSDHDAGCKCWWWFSPADVLLGPVLFSLVLRLQRSIDLNDLPQTIVFTPCDFAKGLGFTLFCFRIIYMALWQKCPHQDPISKSELFKPPRSKN